MLQNKKSLQIMFTTDLKSLVNWKARLEGVSDSDANFRQGLALKTEPCCAEMCRFPVDSAPSFVIHSVSYEIMCLYFPPRLFPWGRKTDYLELGMRALSRYTFTNYAESLWLQTESHGFWLHSDAVDQSQSSIPVRHVLIGQNLSRTFSNVSVTITVTLLVNRVNIVL